MPVFFFHDPLSSGGFLWAECAFFAEESEPRDTPQGFGACGGSDNGRRTKCMVIGLPSCSRY